MKILTKVFFQDIGILDEYNLNLTRSVLCNRDISITIGASTVHTFFETVRLKKSFGNLKSMLMFPPLGKKIQMISARALAFPYRKFFCSFDVLHLNDCSSSYNNYALEVHKPMILSFHDSTLALENDQKKLAPLRALFASMHLITAPSHYMAKIIKEKLGYEPLVVSHGINTQLFADTIPKSWAHKYLGIEPNRKIVLWDSRLSMEKDLATFLEAIPRVIKEVSSVLFVIKGRCVQRRETEYYGKMLLKYLRQETNATTIGSNVMVLPKYVHHEKMPIYYRCADVFVHTSRFESFGFVVGEAMACKTPVISAFAGSTPEVLGDSGLFFKPGDSQDLSEKIIKILTDEDLQRTLGEKARKRIVENFTWARAGQQFSKMYLQIAGETM